jgi:hypothetical protein
MPRSASLRRIVPLLAACLVLSLTALAPADASPSGSQALWRSNFGAGSSAGLRSLGDGARSTVWNGKANTSFSRHAGRDAWNVHLPANQRDGVRLQARFQDLGFQNRRTIRMDYDVFVPNAEAMTLDLKLPGFGSAPANRDLWYVSSGGVKHADSASIRLHTRPAGGWGIPHPYLEAYVYADRGGGQVRGDWGMYWRLSRSLNAMGSRKGDEFAVPIGRWFTVSIEAEMNTPGRADGRLRVWLDGTKGIDITDLVYVTAAPYEWTQTVFSTFYNTGSHPAATVRLANMRFGTLAGGVAPTAGTAPTTSSVHTEAIDRLTRLGIMPSSTVASAPLTRGQMATLIQRALKLPAGDASRFSDAGTHASAIGAVAAAGIAGGYPDGTFRPDERVSRGQMASFLTKAFALPAGTPPRFSDTATSAHRTGIGAVTSAGIAQGYADGTFRPSATVTHGQVATFLVRALDR